MAAELGVVMPARSRVQLAAAFLVDAARVDVPEGALRAALERHVAKVEPSKALAHALRGLDVPTDMFVGSADQLLSRRLPPSVVFDGQGQPWVVREVEGAFAFRPVERDLDESGGPEDLEKRLGVPPGRNIEAVHAPPHLPFDLRSANLFVRLFEIARMERDAVGALSAYAIAVGVLSLAIPVGIQLLVTSLAFGGSTQPLVVLSVLVVVALGFAAVARLQQISLVERVQQRLFVRVGLEFAKRLPRIDRAEFESHGGSRLASRFLEIATLQKGAALLLLDGASVGLQVVAGSLLLAFYHPVLLAFSAILVAAALFVLGVLGRKGGARAVTVSKAKYELADWLAELGERGPEFKARASEEEVSRLARHRLLDYLDARKAYFRVVFAQSAALLLVQAVAVAALLLVGGALVLQGSLTLGQLVASEFVLTGTVTGFVKLGKYAESAYELVASVDKIAHVADLPLDALDRPRLSAVNADAPFELHGSLRTREGESLSTLALLPGKLTTLTVPWRRIRAVADAVSGVQEIAEVRARIDGRPVESFALPSLLDQIVVVRDPLDETIVQSIIERRPHAVVFAGALDDVEERAQLLLRLFAALPGARALAITADPSLATVGDSAAVLDRRDP